MIKLILQHIFFAFGNFLPNIPSLNAKKYVIYNLAGMKISRGAMVTGPLSVRMDSLSNINIGSGSYLNSETRFGCLNCEISIGKNVLVGPRVSFEAATHNLYFAEDQGRGYLERPIFVADNVWIGAGATILAGVSIGEFAVIAAGAVVNKNVPPHTLVGGVPAKTIGQITADGLVRCGLPH